jgi:hypothetical protein
VRALSAVLVLGMVVSIPASAGVRMVCTRGMAEAGPACPLCHGSEASGPPGCCRVDVSDGQPTVLIVASPSGKCDAQPVFLGHESSAQCASFSSELRAHQLIAACSRARPPGLAGKTTILRL